jgi:hypothetical protein
VPHGGGIYVNKKAEIYAGRDIVNLTFTGDNDRDSDVTSIRAGRDLTYAIDTITSDSGVAYAVPAGGSYVIGGPGTLTLEAGRNLDLRPSTADVLQVASVQNYVTRQQQYSVLAVANRINPYRAAFASADTQILFGTGPGKAITAFIDRYIDPAGAGGWQKATSTSWSRSWRPAPKRWRRPAIPHPT